jgi:glucose/arabinose dehydrogenase
MARIATLSFAVLALAGCPGPEAPPADAAGTDAAGTDAGPGTDAPVTPDAPPPACITGYPTLTPAPFLDGLDSPIYITQAPGSDDFFIVQQGGTILVADDTGTIATPFLDISDRTDGGGGESGLLGLAFHPGYEANGLFYVMYTPTSGTEENVVAVGHRATARTAEADVTPILSIPDFASNHNGGCLQFGPDGELYVGTGDGGLGGDPEDNGQDNTQLLGKILRLHVDATTGDSYTIPAGNPFTAPNRTEIWATGLRNPWRFSFDRVTGDFWVGDVGQDTWEEIDVALAGTGAGVNYGWNECEGFSRFGGASDCTLTGHHPPVVVARHGSDPVVGSASSITGGYVYRGSAIPALAGAYVFGDISGPVAALRYCDGTLSEYQQIDELSGECNGYPGPVSFGEDHDGELYMVCLGGSIFRIEAM